MNCRKYVYDDDEDEDENENENENEFVEELEIILREPKPKN